MGKYRKRPIVIEAEQFLPRKKPWPEGVQDLIQDHTRTTLENYVIDTLEGQFQVTPGDWIITGIQGERYPCKPDIFEETYEKVG